MDIKNLLANTCLVAFSILLAFGGGELYLRHTHIGERFGWQRSSTLDDRLAEYAPIESEKSIIIGTFGDSFTEYMKNTPGNFLHVAETKMHEEQHLPVRLLNFGYTGTGLRNYISNFKYINEKIQLDSALFNVYVGNDYSDYWAHYVAHQSGAERDAVLPWPEPHITKESLAATLFRSSIALLAFRTYVWRQYTGVDYLEPSLRSLERSLDVPFAELQRRLRNIPPRFVDMAKAGIVNTGTVAWGIAQPDLLRMHGEGYREWNPHVEHQFFEDLNYLLQLCSDRNIPCLFTFQPTSVSINEKYHAFFQDIGYQVDTTMVKQSELEKATSAFFEKKGAPYLSFYPILTQTDAWLYLENDEHLNFEGNRVIGNALSDWLSRQVISRKKSPLPLSIAAIPSLLLPVAEAENTRGADLQ